MRLFRSIFMAVVFAYIGMPVSFAMTQEEYEECKTNTEFKYMEPFYNFEKDSGYIALYESLYAQAKDEFNVWLNEVNITSTEEDCTVNGEYSGKYTCKAGQTNRECVPKLCWVLQDDTASEFFFEQTVQEEFRQQKVQEECGDAPVSETVEEEESKKSDDADTKSTDASDKKIVSHTFSVSESVNNLSGLTKKVAAETAYRQYLGSKYCDGDGTITIRSDSTQIICSNGWGGGTQPTDSQFTSEHKKALCYAECAGKEREYVSGTYGKCECSVTRAEKRAANQQARDERKAARAEDRAARQEERKKEKAVECDGRNPPMDIKQNDLGLWVCVDTDETIKKREEERKTNKTLDAFWNEMEDLERAFNKRVRQLQRQAKKDGGAK